MDRTVAVVLDEHRFSDNRGASQFGQRWLCDQSGQLALVRCLEQRLIAIEPFQRHLQRQARPKACATRIGQGKFLGLLRMSQEFGKVC